MQADTYVDSALTKMERSTVKHYQADDEYCLSYDERKKMAAQLADFELLDVAFRRQLC